MYPYMTDDVVMALAAAPIDPRTGNRVIYNASWIADRSSMIGERNEDWVRRELRWFLSGSQSLHDMEAPVPQAFQDCADPQGLVNSAYGHILFGAGPDLPHTTYQMSLYERLYDTFIKEGLETRHAVAIISDRDIHNLAHKDGRRDFICTNALNVMVDHEGALHLVAQMRSMDAVWGYRADYSMWDVLMDMLVVDLQEAFPAANVHRGTMTFQVANLHVYPRHHALLERWRDIVADRQDREARRIWMNRQEQTEAQRVQAMMRADMETATRTKGQAHIIADRPQA